jgi:hypothetical protein
MIQLQLAEELFLYVLSFAVGQNILSCCAGRAHLSFLVSLILFFLLLYNKILDLGDADPFLDTEG